MTELRPLMDMLHAYFPWHLARIQCLANVLLALIRVRTVNLADLATAFCGTAKVESHYRRLQRFFQEVDLSQDLMAFVIGRILPLEPRWLLCLDRTNWKFGVLDINILVLAVAYHGIAIPLFWTFLDKRGNSDTTERIALLKRFLLQFGKARIHCVTADREFIGKDWIKFLKKQHILFRIRIRHNTQIANLARTRTFPASAYFRNAPVGEVRILHCPRRIWGMSLFVIGLRLPHDYLILMTAHHPETALADYRRRWEIETLFSCLKSHGFDLEATHLTHSARLSKLVAVLTLALCWCCRMGDWQHTQRPLPVKTHGRRAKSVFRHGLDCLRNIVLNLAVKRTQFVWALQFLSCT
jgi:hypothetical protein